MTETNEDFNELNEVADLYRLADQAGKRNEIAKKKYRTQLLTLISQTVTPEQIGVMAKFSDLEARGGVEGWRAYHYPTWEVLAQEEREYGLWLHLREIATLKKHSFEYNGHRFGRTYRMEGAGFDADALVEWLTEVGETMEAAQFQALDGCIITKVSYDIDEAKLLDVIRDFPELVPAIEQFNSVGKPTVTLTPIKEVE